MRLRIRHETVYRFDAPPSAVVQTLRLTPRSFDGQHVVRWRLDVDRDCRLHASEDAFGNQTHVFAVDGPLDGLAVLVEGEVDTHEVSGVIRGAPERFPPALYLRETDITTPDLEIQTFAGDATAGAQDPLDALHRLLAALHETVAFDPKADAPASGAVEVFRAKRGGAQDLTHVFLAAARRTGAPARFVSGYLHIERAERSAGPSQAQDGASGTQAQGQTEVQTETAADGEADHKPLPRDPGHVWAEAHVPGLGWIGFDPALGFCVTEAHVRIAIGLDFLGAAPVRGSRYGGSGETLRETMKVEDAGAQGAFRRA